MVGVGLDEKEFFLFFLDFIVDEGVGLEVVQPFDLCGKFGFEESGDEFSEFSSIVGEGDDHRNGRKKDKGSRF
jgi:hypothetical protein